ncbi:MAG: potassium channel protein [Actinomycetota bacterium]
MTDPWVAARSAYALAGVVETGRSVRKMVTGVAAFIGVCVVAVIGYLAAGWSLDDAIYFVIITIFGVGYGEVQPVDSIQLRALTIMVIVVGYGAVIYAIGGFIQLVVDGEFDKFIGARRMAKDIESLRDHTIVCGLGRMGERLCRELEALGAPFVVIDNAPEVIDRAVELGYLVVLGDASQENSLERAGIHTASTVAAVLPDDASNVFITLTSRELNPGLSIVSRAEDPNSESKLMTCGANQVVMPTAIGATKMSQLILKPTLTDLLDRVARGEEDVADDIDVGSFGLDLHQVRVGRSSSFVGLTLGELDLREAHGYVVIAVRRADGSTVLHPQSDVVLDMGDTLVLLGYDDSMNEADSSAYPTPGM